MSVAPSQSGIHWRPTSLLAAAAAGRQRYYDCFQAWDNRQDAQPMTALVAEYAQERLRDWLAVVDTSIAPAL
ncbi:MAG: hypothetical protein LBR32_00370 [Propionibacteriaceae bacterium]|nr:hypothetical protein [Propionibacteriaceae bacterium]